MFTKNILAISLLSFSFFSVAETTIPHTFQSGDSISAATMNENFNAIVQVSNKNEMDIASLLERIKVLEDLNQQSEELETDIARFDGTFTAFGQEVILSSCDEGAKISQSGIPTRVTISNGSMILAMDGSTTEMINVNQADVSINIDSLDGESAIFTIAVDGHISSEASADIRGTMAADGNSFVLYSLSQEETEGCSRGSVFNMSGIRTR